MAELHDNATKTEAMENKTVREIGQDEFWVLAWLSTIFSGAICTAAGCLFTFQMGEVLLILFFCSVLIGICATPIMLTFAIVTWALWLTRFRLFIASLAGGLSCATAAVACLNNTNHVSDGWVLFAFEALSGGIGCLLVLYLIGRTKSVRNPKEEVTKTLVQFLQVGQGESWQNKTEKMTKTPWQFTMRDLFMRFTVLAVLISFWTVLFPYFYHFISQHRFR